MRYPKITYNVCIEIKSPVHIGSNEDYDPTSFVVDVENKQLKVFNPLQFISTLDESEIMQLKKITSKGNEDSIYELYRFMSTLNPEGRSVSVVKEFITKYKKEVIDGKPKKNQLNNFAIARTSYNQTDKRPYIPGSSIKGSLRTACLNYLAKSKQKVNLYKDPKKDTRHQKLEANLLGLEGKFINPELDPFKLVSVSDFSPIGEAPTEVCYVVDHAKKGDKTGAPTVLEIIKPGAKFIGSITITDYDTINEKSVGQKINIGLLEQSLSYFYKNEYERELDEVSHLIKNKNLLEKGDILLRVGKHSGAECVTIDGYREIKIKGPRNHPNPPQSYSNNVRLASKSQNSMSDMQPLGWCAISFLSNDELKGLRLQKEEEEKAKREQERIEADLKANPWKVFLSELDSVSNWGELRQAMTKDQASVWAKEYLEISKKIVELAAEIKNQDKKKWTDERVTIVLDWLEGVDIDTSAILDSLESDNSPEQELIDKIKGIANWTDYTALNLSLDDLSYSQLHYLKSKFEELGYNKKKAKKDRKAIYKKVIEKLELKKC